MVLFCICEILRKPAVTASRTGRSTGARGVMSWRRRTRPRCVQPSELLVFIDTSVVLCPVMQHMTYIQLHLIFRFIRTLRHRVLPNLLFSQS